MQLKWLDGQHGRFTHSLPHLLNFSLRSSTKCIFTVFFLSRSDHISCSVEQKHLKAAFFSVSLCIYTMHWQRSRAFLPAGFFVYFLSTVIYILSAEKEPLTLTQIENMPSSYFCVCNPCTWMPLPRVIVAVLYFSNRISCVCVRSCTPADVNVKNSPVSSVLKSCSPLRWLSALQYRFSLAIMWQNLQAAVMSFCSCSSSAVHNILWLCHGTGSITVPLTI